MTIPRHLRAMTSRLCDVNAFRVSVLSSRASNQGRPRLDHDAEAILHIGYTPKPARRSVRSYEPAILPPSTTMTVPVIKLDALEASKSATPAISEGSATRPSGTLEASSASIATI